MTRSVCGSVIPSFVRSACRHFRTSPRHACSGRQAAASRRCPDVWSASSQSTQERFCSTARSSPVGVGAPPTCVAWGCRTSETAIPRRFPAYADTYNALLDGRGDAFSTDNTEVLAWAKQNPGHTVGATSLGDVDTIAPAVSKGNSTLLDYVNSEITSLVSENFFHNDYARTLGPIYGDEADVNSIVADGGQV